MVDPSAFGTFNLGDILARSQQTRMQQAQLRAVEGQEQRRQQLGELLPAALTGNEKAMAGVFSADPAVGMQLQQQRREREAQRWTRTAPHAYRARQLATPQERQAYLQQIAPQLRSYGWTDQELATVDLSDAGLDAIITSGQTLEQAMERDRIRWETAPEGGRTFATDQSGRPIAPGMAGSPSQAPGTPQPAPQAQGAPQAAQTSQAAPTGYAGGVAQALAGSGVSPPVIAGILANGHYESSGWNLGASGDGGTAHGAFQWRNERVQNFQRITGTHPSRATPQQTAQFVMWELQNPEAAGMTREQSQAILNARTPQEAALLFSRYYERPNARQANNSRRIALASQYAQGGAPTAASQPNQMSIQEQAATGVINVPPRAPEGMIMNPDGSLTPRPGSQQEFERNQAAERAAREARGEARQGRTETREQQREWGALQQNFRQDPDIRKWREARTAVFQLRALGRSARPSDDMAMIFSFMRVLDPTSTVREGEYASVQDTASIPERIRNAYNYAQAGNRLTPAMRADIIATAGRLYTDRSRTYNEVVEGYRQQAAEMGVPRERIGRAFQTAVAPRAADARRAQGQRRGGQTTQGVGWAVVRRN